MPVTIELTPEIAARDAAETAVQRLPLSDRLRHGLEERAAAPGRKPAPLKSGRASGVSRSRICRTPSHSRIKRSVASDLRLAPVSVLIDTNVLLRRTQPDHPHHQVAVGSVDRLLASREPVHFTLRNIAEFWNVATRPAEHNGLGFTVAMVRAQIGLIRGHPGMAPRHAGHL